MGLLSDGSYNPADVRVVLEGGKVVLVQVASGGASTFMLYSAAATASGVAAYGLTSMAIDGTYLDGGLGEDIYDFFHPPSDEDACEGVVKRSSYQKAKFLKELAKSGKYPTWMNQWLGKGKVPPGYEVDHIVPISVGGADSPSNMRLMSKDMHQIHHKHYQPWRGE